MLGDRAAVEAIRRYRTQGLSDPSAIEITTEDFKTRRSIPKTWIVVISK
ncbi:hypothetical protein [Floridanema flaviceps]